MSEKAKAGIPVVIGAMAIALALGSVDDNIVVEINKEPTPYSAAHSRVQSSDAPVAEPIAQF